MNLIASVLSSALSFLAGLYLGRKAHPESEEYGVQGVDPPRCGDLRMFPYDHGDEGFGYQDWSCFLPMGHAGQHIAENPDWRRS